MIEMILFFGGRVVINDDGGGKKMIEIVCKRRIETANKYEHNKWSTFF